MATALVNRDRDRPTPRHRDLTNQPTKGATPRTSSGRAGTDRQTRHAHYPSPTANHQNHRSQVNAGGSRLSPSIFLAKMVERVLDATPVNLHKMARKRRVEAETLAAPLAGEQTREA